MRIIAGTARGRPIQGPRGTGLRPTSDRVRQAIFNVLGQFFDGGEVLDLFAGTGALGLEALSRGMAKAVLVDSGREAQMLVRENAATLGFAQRCELMPLDALQAVERLGHAGRTFEIIFADPPYALEAVAKLGTAIERGAILRPGGALCIEHDKREPAPAEVGSLVRADERRFGDTVFSIYRILDPSRIDGDA